MFIKIKNANPDAAIKKISSILIIIEPMVRRYTMLFLAPDKKLLL
jgi:hypothetical protein